MILDERSEFCDATTLNAGAAGTYLLGNVINLNKTGLDLGQGDPLWLVIQISTTAASAGSATATFKLASDAQAAIATDGTATIHLVSDTLAVANLTAGTVVLMAPLPRSTYERYLGLLQVTGTAAFTAGKINAFLTTDPNGWKAYANA